MIIRWLSDDYPLIIRQLSNDYPVIPLIIRSFR